MSQNTGMKIPKKNIHLWPFQSVDHPSVNTNIRYTIPPMPNAHHMFSPFALVSRHVERL